MKRLFVIIVSICSFVIACKNKSENKIETPAADNTKTIDGKADSLLQAKRLQDSVRSVHRKDSILLKLTQNILLALKNKNYSAFTNYIHPQAGVRFSPYAFIDTVGHIKFSKNKFIAEANKIDQDMMVWGSFDGTGDPIRMKLNNYLQRFVYDVDFVKPEKRSVNKFISGGNSLNNLDSVYKDCDFTESHFSGFEKKYEGQDWRTLRLVFKERNGKFFLVGIVHDEWTI
jgi:hypothetical protein